MSQTLIKNDHIFVISDLHLADPSMPELENFTVDQTFLRFLSEDIPGQTNGAPSTLIILGDFIDFVRAVPTLTVTNAPPNVGPTEDESLVKLEAVIKGHSAAFDALATFLDRDHQVVIVPGNHDADLFWPGVRTRIETRLGGSRSNLSLLDRWGFADRGIFCEHGHQASFENRYEQSPPFVMHDGRQHLERAWGSFFMEAVYNQLEYFAPWIHKVHPMTRAFFLGVRRLGWDKIPPTLLPALVGFVFRHGKRVMLEHALGSNDVALSDDQVLATFGLDVKTLPPELVARARTAGANPSAIGADSDAEPRPGGNTLGRTDERGIESVAMEQLSLPSIHTAIFGHTHRAFAREVPQFPGKRHINTGTWTGVIDLKTGEDPTYEELVERAKNARHKLTYAYIGPDATPGVIREVVVEKN